VKRATQLLSIGALALVLTASSALAGSQVTASKAALATASPYATQIGLSVLKSGGNAVDASVAVAFALAVAHPQAGNLGGGGFLVYYDAKTGAVWTLDFREMAPMAAKRNMFLQEDGSVGGTSRTGPLAAGVPGVVAGLSAMHEKFGKQSWKELIQPAATLARRGIVVDPAMAKALEQTQAERKIDQFPSTAALYFPEGKPLAVGAHFVQKDLADTLDRIAAFGARDFYDGQIADKMVQAIRTGGGNLGYRDLQDYKALWRAPMKIRFGEYDLYTMAPPSAGGLVMGEVLNIIGTFDLAKAGFQTPRSLHLLAEAERRAYLDRNKYLGDPASTRIPYRELLSAERAAQWRSSINPDRATATVTLAEPGGTAVAEGNHTTHFTIVDGEGNIAAVTTTLNDNFGSGFVVPGLGFLLNDEMDDFAAAPGKPNHSGLVQGSANAIEPGKRMASSMSPTIILRNGKPFLALGTRGGPTIPTSLLQVFLNVALYKKSLYDAIAAPRYHHQALPDQISYERAAPLPTITALAAMGHGTVVRDDIGDVQAILFDRGRIVAVADPRGSGAAGGY
jgi:gamma-glutamyltranspeptidase/glutathione hydrolase